MSSAGETPGMAQPAPRRAWYVACLAEDLGREPLARTLLGIPLVLFRGADGKAATLLDRCAHRNVPLSLGHCTEGRLECRYHGWQYEPGGQCAKIPGLLRDSDRAARSVPSYATREQDGFVWVFAAPGIDPPAGPFALPSLGEGATRVRRVVTVESPLHAALENALDVPHTAVLHRGLFRGSRARQRITARVTRTPDGLQAEYLGEPRPEGLAAKILAPSGGVVTHFDRFILPSIAQVEYRLGGDASFIVNSICTPIDDYLTRIHAVIAFQTRLPGWIVKPLLAPFATRIFKQDAAILKAQADSLRRFGGEHYASTAIDILGLQIARLLRHPEGDDGAGDWSREIELEV